VIRRIIKAVVDKTSTHQCDENIEGKNRHMIPPLKCKNFLDCSGSNLKRRYKISDIIIRDSNSKRKIKSQIN
jgi:hypothetical protein